MAFKLKEVEMTSSDIDKSQIMYARLAGGARWGKKYD